MLYPPTSYGAEAMVLPHLPATAYLGQQLGEAEGLDDRAVAGRGHGLGREEGVGGEEDQMLPEQAGQGRAQRGACREEREREPYSR